MGLRQTRQSFWAIITGFYYERTNSNAAITNQKTLMMWSTVKTSIQPNKITRYHLNDEQGRLTWRQVLDLWSHNAEFVQFYNELLVSSDFDSFYWEHPPTQRNQWHSPYEFVLIKGSSMLDNLEPDHSPFAKKFETGKMIQAFDNLRKDARLVVPQPLSPESKYAHLADFVRSAPEEQIQLFWKQVGLETATVTDRDKRWLSTAGLGVSWLHVRIDSRPKYYKFGDYKIM